MTNKQLAVVGIVIAVFAILAYVVLSGMGAEDTTKTENNTSSNSLSKTYKAEEVAKHESESDCWTIINDKVYDITTYISQHPNNEILRACGVDGSSLFNQRMTEDGETIGSGTPHDNSAQEALAQLQIGVISN